MLQGSWPAFECSGDNHYIRPFIGDPEAFRNVNVLFCDCGHQGLHKVQCPTCKQDWWTSLANKQMTG